MKASDLVEAGSLSANYGVKCVVFGGPGSGKTPLINTAPKPVMLAIEPGMASMRGSKVATWEAQTSAKVDEFFTWLKNSGEHKMFDTIAIDSLSQMAENKLNELLRKGGNKLAHYGTMASWMLEHLETLHTMKYKHTYLIAKQEVELIANINIRRPSFPGKELYKTVPHMFDLIMHCGLHMIEGTDHKAFLCTERIDYVTRDRYGKCFEYEPPHIGNLFAKIMS